MAIRRFDTTRGGQKKDIARASPGGTGTVLVRVDIEPTLAGPNGKAAVLAALDDVRKRVASSWPI